MNRRGFLAAGLGLAGTLARRGGAPLTRYRIARPGIQLYSVRGLLQRDFSGTLARLAALGFVEVEFAGLFDHPAAQVRSWLDRAGLRAPAGHVGLEAVRDQLPRVMGEAQSLGHEYIVVPWIDADLRTPEGIRQVAAVFNRVGEATGKQGLGFAYHNHDFEFQKVGNALLYDQLLQATDPELVKLELDLYWIRKGGQDPLTYFARYPGRFPLVHLKDMAADGSMVDLGRGVIDWGAILARHAQAGIRHYFAEHDDPPDPLGFARNAVRFQRRLRF
jgi:sugar phosphate isomerase/epimerase